MNLNVSDSRYDTFKGNLLCSPNTALHTKSLGDPTGKNKFSGKIHIYVTKK